uniref:Uncharacterized protein n=1 Tax=Rhizophora mucronata TaxID=61149 RepID=A0A2P2QJI2_RHIMU
MWLLNFFCYLVDMGCRRRRRCSCFNIRGILNKCVQVLPS